jgi:hypothetical protein
MTSPTRFNQVVERSRFPSNAVTRLNALDNKLAPLYGVQNETLTALDFDSVINELRDVSFNLTEIADISNDMAVTDQALTIILDYLRNCGDQLISPQAVYVLLQPLHERHAAIWDAVNDLV